MITVSDNKIDTKVNTDIDASKGLDGLIESICESYDIPASSISEMKSGLENVLYEFLTKFISDNNIVTNESAGVDILIDDFVGSNNSIIDMILESIRFNGIVNVKCNGDNLINLVNISESITYQLGKVEVDDIDSDDLIEAWRCTDAEKLRPLLTSIVNQSKKEG
jgi:hypothetical protein